MISAVSIFALFTLITFENNATSDGFTKVGFPFNFYIYSEGKLTNPAFAASFGFSVKFFVIDLFLLVAFIFIVNFIVDKWVENKIKN